MRTRRQEFIGVAVALAVCWAGGAQGAAPPQRCKEGHAPRAFPATGQTTSYRVGDDGNIQADATLSYTDNGDGTITDNNTCLVWEKKSDDGSIHDQHNVYTWDGAFDTHVATLNATTFAGYNDWRVPSVKELQSILNYGMNFPSVSSEFNNNCTTGSTVLTGSCTAASDYWSSSTDTIGFQFAWVVDFNSGRVLVDFKPAPPRNYVRAVRGRSDLGRGDEDELEQDDEE
ncbi:MAG: hypothetical protein DME17_10020 [Candidatus Rokuibacteriota bacterium]|nr:MAG: hypothetical protein DME17_10020 [Candidatus Rokubacteria bacterium]